MYVQKKITVRDSLQKCTYYRVEPAGKNFHPDFKPDLTPQKMLKMGVFGGKYLIDCQKEYPKSWFTKAKLSDEYDPEVNYFKIDASQSLVVWQKKGWIHPMDPRGWFQWYARYHMGRRFPEEDARQIKRWKAIKRHVAQVQKNCAPRDMNCRKKQRQALLHWAYDSRKL